MYYIIFYCPREEFYEIEIKIQLISGFISFVICIFVLQSILQSFVNRNRNGIYQIWLLTMVAGQLTVP